jgi:hypothetical protein
MRTLALTTTTTGLLWHSVTVCLCCVQMLVLHQGQPFIPITGKASTFTGDAAEQQADAGWQQSEPGSSKGNRLAPLDQQSRDCSPDGAAQQHWRHNKHTGGMFSKHLKQVY